MGGACLDLIKLCVCDSLTVFVDDRSNGTRDNAAFDLVMESPVIKKVHFPNWVLGYSSDRAPGGGYVWTVEYQCMAVAGFEDYMGFNLYHRSRTPPAADLAAMRQVMVDAGMGDYWTKLHRISGPECKFPPL